MTDEMRVAVVAAASRGLGRAAAEALARRGVRVALCSRSAEESAAAAAAIAAETGSKTLGVAADVQSASSIAGFVHAAVEAFGRIDIVVTNAGGPPSGGFRAFDDETWLAAFQLTFMSTVRLIRETLPFLERSPAAAIVNIASSSVRQPIPNLTLSNAFRPAVLGLAKSLAEELGPLGIRVNTVAPGRIDTSRVRMLDEQRAQAANISVSELVAQTARSIPLGRYGHPVEIGETIAFIATSASYVTGTTLMVDGGMVKGL